MKVCYLHQYFKTPQEGGAIRSYHIARAMINAGHQVTMITSHNKQQIVESQIDGIDVVYIPVFYSNRLSFMKRIWAYLKFMVLAYKQSKNVESDIIYATSTPLTIGIIAWLLKKKNNTPYIFEVRDLWPSIPIQLGYIKSFIAKKFLYYIEKKIYQNALQIIALSPPAVNYISKLVSSSKITLVPNMSDCNFFHPVTIPSENFNIAYVGTFGKANHLQYLFDVAKLTIEKNLPIYFHLIGEGAEYEHWKLIAQNYSNVRVSPFGDKYEVIKLLDSCQATYTSFLDHQALTGMSPNKFFDSLAAGKLNIINCKGWLKDEVEKHGIGFYHDPLRPSTFIQQIKPFLDQPTKLQEAQIAARKRATEHYSIDLLTNKILNLLPNS